MTASVEDLKHCLCHTLIETGTYLGQGVSTALWAGYQEVLSIEKHEPFAERARERFRGDSRVKIWTGSSDSQLLWEMFQATNSPLVTVLLDAHPIPDVEEVSVGSIPIWGEIIILSMFASRIHAVIVDDVEWLSNNGLSREALKELLLGIHSDFQITDSQGGHVWRAIHVRSD